MNTDLFRLKFISLDVCLSKLYFYLYYWFKIFQNRWVDSLAIVGLVDFVHSKTYQNMVWRSIYDHFVVSKIAQNYRVFISGLLKELFASTPTH